MGGKTKCKNHKSIKCHIHLDISDNQEETKYGTDMYWLCLDNYINRLPHWTVLSTGPQNALIMNRSKSGYYKEIIFFGQKTENGI